MQSKQSRFFINPNTDGKTQTVTATDAPVPNLENPSTDRPKGQDKPDLTGLFMLTRREIILNQPVIYSPSPDCVYRLVNPNNPSLITTVTFQGDAVSQAFAYDAEAGMFELRNGSGRFLLSMDTALLTKESINMDIPKLPLHVYHAQGYLFFPSEINISMPNADGVSFTMKGCQYMNLRVNADNKKLGAECAIEIHNKTKVSTGNYPLSIAVNNPTFGALENIYQQFLRFNTDQKLAYQYDKTSGFCHMRAHFVNVLLNHYGITSFKVFKEWDPSDWQHFTVNRSWGFHSAVMLVDNENKKWIWDPWVGVNHNLLTLNEWLFQDNEPKPNNLLIANWVVTNPKTLGHAAYGSSFSCHSKDHLKAFQVVCGDAVPNLPQLNRHCFFERRELALISYQDPLDIIFKSSRQR